MASIASLDNIKENEADSNYKTSGSSKDYNENEDDEKLQMNGHLTKMTVICLMICVLGSSFQVGWTAGVYNTPQKVIKDFYNESYSKNNETMTESNWTFLWALTNSLNPFGGIIGGLASGYIADLLGRKRSMLFINIIVLISGVLSVISKPANTYQTIIAGRFFAGVFSGLFCGVAPMYLSEIPPLNYRGVAGVMNQLMITIGILVANIMGLPSLLGSETAWPYLVAICFIPMIIHFIGLPFCVESPKYLYINKKDPEGAEAVLRKIRDNGNLIKNELREMAAEVEQAKTKEEVRFLDLISQYNLRKPLIVAIVLQLTQQLSGINAVVYYSTAIFINIGLDKDTWAVYATIILSVVNVLMTFVSMALIDIAGRRILMIFGCFGMSFFCVLLTVSRELAESINWLRYIAVVAVVGYIIFFAIGPGAIPWLITAELFNSDARGKASSIAVFTNFFSNFLVTITFPFIEAAIKNYSFIVFGALLILFGLFIIFKVPETRNKTVEEINKFFE